jgi:hypothetical protein
MGFGGLRWSTYGRSTCCSPNTGRCVLGCHLYSFSTGWESCSPASALLMRVSYSLSTPLTHTPMHMHTHTHCACLFLCPLLWNLHLVFQEDFGILSSASAVCAGWYQGANSVPTQSNWSFSRQHSSTHHPSLKCRNESGNCHTTNAHLPGLGERGWGPYPIWGWGSVGPCTMANPPPHPNLAERLGHGASLLLELVFSAVEIIILISYLQLYYDFLQKHILNIIKNSIMCFLFILLYTFYWMDLKLFS